MITKKNLKLFLSFLSLVAFISCSAGDKFGSETQGSQTVSGEGKGGLKTNLPIWSTGTYIPQEYWGEYHDLTRNPMATVTANAISFYSYKDGGGFLYTVNVSDDKTTYLGNNTWHYYYDKLNYGNNSTIKFKRNEKGQRVMLENPLGTEYTFVHVDDINK